MNMWEYVRRDGSGTGGIECNFILVQRANGKENVLRGKCCLVSTYLAQTEPEEEAQSRRTFDIRYPFCSEPDERKSSVALSNFPFQFL